MRIINKFRGSNLVEYAIPLTVIGMMVGLTLYSFSANDVLKNMVTSSVGGTVSTDGSLVVGHKTVTSPIINNSSTTTTPPSTTPPSETACIAGECTLDFETFKLTGVPEDFASFIKSNGVSGGQNLVASLFKQIADQLAADPTNTDPTDQEIIKQIRIMAAYTGTDIDLQTLYPSDTTLPTKSQTSATQNEAIICALEYKIGGGTCNGNLTDLGSNQVKIYDSIFNINSPEELIERTNTAIMNTSYAAFLDACNNSTSGKNYTKLKSSIEFLKNQSTSISINFKDNYIVSDFSDPHFGEINPIGLAAIRDNVASNAENFTSQLMQMTK